jgi:hypothetical protein
MAGKGEQKLGLVQTACLLLLFIDVTNVSCTNRHEKPGHKRRVQSSRLAIR